MMIKNACFILVLSSLVLLSLTIGARAQNPKTAHAAIPFEFCVEGKLLTRWGLHRPSMSNDIYLLFRSTDGKSIAAVFVLPVDEDSASEADSKLIFRVENGRALSIRRLGTIWQTCGGCRVGMGRSIRRRQKRSTYYVYTNKPRMTMSTGVQSTQAEVSHNGRGVFSQDHSIERLLDKTRH